MQTRSTTTKVELLGYYDKKFILGISKRGFHSEDNHSENKTWKRVCQLWGLLSYKENKKLSKS